MATRVVSYIEDKPGELFYIRPPTPPGRNDPEIRDIVDYKTIRIGFGNVIRGHIAGIESVEIEHGSIIVGSITSHGLIKIEYGGYGDIPNGKQGIPTTICGSIAGKQIMLGTKPQSKTQLKYWSERPLLILGNISGDNIRIEGRVVIRGNIYATKNLVVDGTLYITGMILHEDEKGKVYIKNTTCYCVISRGTVEVDHGVTLINPLIIGRKINFLASGVRYMGSICMNCKLEQKEKFACKPYMEGKCTNYPILTPIFAVKSGDAVIFSPINFWGPGAINKLYDIAESFLANEIMKRNREKTSIINFAEKIKHPEVLDQLGSAVDRALAPPVLSPEAAKWLAIKEIKKAEIEAELKKTQMLINERLKVLEIMSKSLET